MTSLGAVGRRIPGYLGRVLDGDGTPAGTCFQVAPGVLVTAAHVLAEVGAPDVGTELSIDPLSEGQAFGVTVACADPDHDIAVLVSQSCLPSVADTLADTDGTPLRAEVSATGHVVVDDKDYLYRYLVAAAEWAGPARRDSTLLGSMTTARIMPGMSGAPVVRDSDGVVVGVVSGRYNSADGWLTGSVWVARIEDLMSLLRQIPGIRVDRVLRVGDNVTTVLLVSNVSDMTGDSASRSDQHALFGAGSSREAAWEAAKVLTALDDGAQGMGALVEVAHDLASKAASRQRCSGEELLAFRRRIRLLGLSPRLLMPLAGHREAIERWTEQISGISQLTAGSDLPPILAAYVEVLIEELSGTLFSSLSSACRDLLRQALAGEDTLPVYTFLLALEEALPVRRSTSREVVLYRNEEDDEPSAGHRPPVMTYRERGLRAAATQLCRLPDADPCIRGRDACVAEIVSAVSNVMARDGAATCFLSGQPGVGTSTVAVDAARQLTSMFPGGSWYVNLFGLVPGSRRDSRTVVRLLAEAMALDLGSGAMGDERMFAAFAAELSQRKVLVVLDNAEDAAHVDRLVRPSVGSCVVVTSRNRLQDYASPGLVFGIGVLDHDAAVNVLKIFADEQVCDLAPLDVLANLCDDVPLALRMIGARIAARPQVELDYLVHLLSEEVRRLDYLEVGDRAVRAAIRLSYDNLDTAAQMALRFITAVPGAMASADELEHSLGDPASRQEMLLNRLADRNLLQLKVVRGYVTGSRLAMFSPFELVRLFARERLLAEAPAEQISGFERKAVGYLSDRLSQIVAQVRDAELTWELDPARFHAALHVAEDRGWLEVAEHIALDLHVLYQSRREIDSAYEVNDLLVNLHLKSGNYEEAVRACLRMAESLGDLDESEHVVSSIRRAGDLARTHNLPLLAAEADFAMSILLRKIDDLQGAFDASERAANALLDLGLQGIAIGPALNSCKLAIEQDQSEKAVSWGRRAMELASRAGNTTQQAAAALNYGRAEGQVRNFVMAAELSRQAGALYEEISAWWNSAVGFDNGAYFSWLSGDTAHAAEMYSLEADRWERVTKEEGRPRLLECLMDLSAVHVEMSAFEQAQAALQRAEKLITSWPRSIPVPMRLEAYIRKAAVRLFLEDLHNIGGRKEESIAPVEHDGEGTEQSAEPDAELERMEDVIRRYNSGAITNTEARRLVTNFLASPARHHPESKPFWLYEDVNFSSHSKTAINSTPGHLPALVRDND